MSSFCHRTSVTPLSLCDGGWWRAASVWAQLQSGNPWVEAEWKETSAGLRTDSGYRVGTDGLLVIEARPYQSGNYCCSALENGVHVPVVIYNLTVRQEPRAPPPVEPMRPHLTTAIYGTIQTSPSDSLEDFHSTPMSPRFEFLSMRNMEAMYLSLIIILGGLCFVLTVILLYVGFCLQGRRGKYSLRAAARTERKRGAHMELKTISSHCNGKTDAHDGLLQIVPGEATTSPNKELPPAPPLPPPPESEYVNGLSATLPSILRKMNGNSYVLLRQTDGDTTSPLYYSFTEELNRILEKRKHTQLCSKPDESSVWNRDAFELLKCSRAVPSSNTPSSPRLTLTGC